MPRAYCKGAATERVCHVSFAHQTHVNEMVSDPFGNAIGIIENPHFTVADVR